MSRVVLSDTASRAKEGDGDRGQGGRTKTKNVTMGIMAALVSYLLPSPRFPLMSPFQPPPPLIFLPTFFPQPSPPPLVRQLLPQLGRQFCSLGVGQPGCSPRRGIALLLPIKRDYRDVVVPRGGRILSIVAVLDNNVNPGNRRNVVVIVIPLARWCPQLVWGRNVVFFIFECVCGYRRVLLPSFFP